MINILRKRVKVERRETSGRFYDIFWFFWKTENTDEETKSVSSRFIALIRFSDENFANRPTTYDAFIESYDVAARLVHASVKDMKQLGFKRGFARDYPGLEHFT